MIALTDDYVLSTIAKRKGSTTSGRLKIDSDCADTKVCRAYLDDMTARGILDREKCGTVCVYSVKGAAL